MHAYAPEIERKMKKLFDSLSEDDRRRYAAVEATKLGHGGIEYIAKLLECDPKTIRRGLAELEEGTDLDTSRVRKKTRMAKLAEGRDLLNDSRQIATVSGRKPARNSVAFWRNKALPKHPQLSLPS